MDEQAIRLYGYEKETKTIENAISEGERLCFVCLHGPGGIGKTTMLRTVYEKYKNDDAHPPTKLLDFDDLRLQIVQNIMDQIAEQLTASEASFAAYFEAAARLREIQRQGVSRLRVEDQEKRVREAFLEGSHSLAAQRRPVLIFDTVEKVQDLAFWQELTTLLLQLKNTVVLLAGRRNDEVGKSLQARLETPNTVEVISLGGLSETERMAYFRRTDLGQFLANEDPDQAQMVCRLSDGLPILIDLAVDWLGQGIKLPTPAQVPETLDDDEIRRRFRQGLVGQINDLGKPRNEAILEMAHIYHYFDAERFCYLHPEYSEEDAQALLGELRGFSFVKPQPSGGLRLHDEMQRLVSKYVWSVLDRNLKRRRWLSERMVQFYDERIAEYEDDPVVWQALVAEQLYHRLYSDLKQGHWAFRPIFRQALSRHRRDFARMLLDTLTQDEFYTNFDAELEAWAEIHKGRLLREKEQIEEAVELIRPAKEELQKLGVCEGLDTVCNALGYSYRLLGNWGEAIAAYEEALHYSRQENDARQIAETMNNIANTCRLGGDFERANRYSVVGLKIREKLDDKRAMGNSCYVRGMILWETGNTVEAYGYFRRARKFFTEIDNLEGLAGVYRYEGYLHFRTGDLEEALRLVRQANRIFTEQSIGLGMADTLNLEARILIDKCATEGETTEGFQEIEILAQRALDSARRIRDHYTIAECHLTLCRLYYRWGRHCQRRGEEAKAQEYYGLGREQYDAPGGGQAARQRSYLALQGVYEWVMGDLAYDAEDWDLAFDHYMEECEAAARFKRPRFARALNALSDRLHRLPTMDGTRELTRQYCDYVIAGWKSRGLAPDFPEVIEECEYINNLLKLVDPQYLKQLEQWGADLLVRGEWQRAVEVYQELLDASETYAPGEQATEAMNQAALAYGQMGYFTEARRLCQQSLLIRQEIGASVPIARSRLVMGTIMWPTGNTSEAARYFRLARDLFRKAKEDISLARANHHLAFMHFRIGDHEKAQNYLEEAEKAFREKNLYADLSDVLNLHARILRQEGEFEEAHKLADESRHLAEKSGAHYALAQAWLTLGLIEYDASQKMLGPEQHEEKAQHIERARMLHSKGYQIAERYGYDLLLSVYESTAGGIAFEEGRHADAFEHYLRDLEFGVRYEQGRMRRELDRIVDRLVQLPRTMRRFYADYMIMEWQDKGLTDVAPDVPRLFNLLKEYFEYV